ncbi:MAG: putative toxin-antitoxin system toxin component, PIN family [Candidatus Bathyarchaeales archaeon]
MVRVAIDTNVLVSALIKRGKSRKLVCNLLEGHTVILSRQILAELADVLARDKFAVTPAQADKFLAILVRNAKIVAPTSYFQIIKEDPGDDIILNTAYAGKAEYLVTGDKHLLALKEFKRIKIVKINQMIENLR